MQASTERPGYGIYYELMQKLVNAVIFVEADKYNEDFVEDFKKVFSKSMEVKGLSAHTFTVLTLDSSAANYFEQQAVAHQVCDRDRNAWIYDEHTDKLIVYEEQAEEFYGLRNIIEKLEPPEDYKPYEDIPVEQTSFKDKVLAGWKSLPKVTSAIILLNLIIYILCTFTGELLYNKGAAGVSLVSTPDQWYRVISSMFLHLNVTHIANNMLLLFFLGQIVEDKLGPVRFTAAYFVTGICGTLCTFLSEIISDRYVVVFGASGAVFGILGVMFALVFCKRIHRRHMTVTRLLLVISLSIADGFNPSNNVANWSHIGGLISGIIIGVIFCLCSNNNAGVTNED